MLEKTKKKQNSIGFWVMFHFVLFNFFLRFPNVHCCWKYCWTLSHRTLGRLWHKQAVFNIPIILQNPKFVLEPWCSSYRHLVLQRVQFCYQYDESQQLVSDSFICIKGALYRHSKWQICAFASGAKLIYHSWREMLVPFRFLCFLEVWRKIPRRKRHNEFGVTQ